jgi:hypothetical protein
MNRQIDAHPQSHRPFSAVTTMSIAALLRTPLLMLSVIGLSSAAAHVHRSEDRSMVSWYPKECCRDGDCRPVTRVQKQQDGFLLTTEDGATLYVSSSSVRRYSLDNRWHVCFGAYEEHRVVCVFEPGAS